MGCFVTQVHPEWVYHTPPPGHSSRKPREIVNGNSVRLMMWSSNVSAPIRLLIWFSNVSGPTRVPTFFKAFVVVVLNSCKSFLKAWWWFDQAFDQAVCVEFYHVISEAWWWFNKASQHLIRLSRDCDSKPRSSFKSKHLQSIRLSRGVVVKARW